MMVRWVLGLVLLLLGSHASAMCGFFGIEDPGSDGYLPLPGEVGYTPEGYAKRLWLTFEYAFEAPDKIVVIGNLANLNVADGGDQPIFAEKIISDAEEQFTMLYRDGSVVDYSFNSAFSFAGRQVTDRGLISLPDTIVGLRFTIGETGGAGDPPTIGPSPRVFSLEYEDWGELDSRLYATPTVCGEIPAGSQGAGFPAPDEAALRALTTCIRNRGCD